MAYEAKHTKPQPAGADGGHGARTRAERALQVATVIVFCGFVGGLGVASLVAPDAETSATEKRALTTASTLAGDLDLDSIAEGLLQDDVADYLSDQFVGRSSWVSLKTAAELALGKSEINDIYLGKDGYLIEKYTESSFVSEDDDEDATPSEILEDVISVNTATLAYFANDMVALLGADSVRVALVPGKANILTNYLPDYAETTSIQQQMRAALVEQLDSADTVWVDLTDTLQAHQDEYIYYRTDHHWTTRGAYYAYAQIMGSLGLSVADYSSYETEVVSTDFLGTSYNSSLYYTLADEIVAVRTEAAEASTIVAVATEDEDDEDWDVEDDEDVEDVYLDEDGNEISEEDAWDEEEDADEEEGLVEYDSIYFEDALDGDDPYLYFMGDNYGRCTVTTGTENGKTLFLIKDSYANSMIPFLAEQYETIVVFDPRYTSESITDFIYEAVEDGADDADVLVVLSDEKFLMNRADTSYQVLLNDEGIDAVSDLLGLDGEDEGVFDEDEEDEDWDEDWDEEDEE